MTTESSDTPINSSPLSISRVWVHFLLNNRIFVGTALSESIYHLSKPLEILVRQNGNQVTMGFSSPWIPFFQPENNTLVIVQSAVSHSIRLDSKNKELYEGYMKETSGLFIPPPPESFKLGGSY